MTEPKIFIGPMSKNIVDAIIEYANYNNVGIGIIPSRRQVEYDGGYVNNWKTRDFFNYIKSRTNNVLLVRDHAGPSQGTYDDYGLVSFVEDCDYMDLIHVDVWKRCPIYEDGLKATIEFIELGYHLNKDMCYEIGTEESIRPTTPYELNKLINDLRDYLDIEVFEKIKYLDINHNS